MAQGTDCSEHLQITKARPGKVIASLEIQKHNGALPQDQTNQLLIDPSSQSIEQSTRRANSYPRRYVSLLDHL